MNSIPNLGTPSNPTPMYQKEYIHRRFDQSSYLFQQEKINFIEETALKKRKITDYTIQIEEVPGEFNGNIEDEPIEQQEPNENQFDSEEPDIEYLFSTDSKTNPTYSRAEKFLINHLSYFDRWVQEDNYVEKTAPNKQAFLNEKLKLPEFKRVEACNIHKATTALITIIDRLYFSKAGRAYLDKIRQEKKIYPASAPYIPLEINNNLKHRYVKNEVSENYAELAIRLFKGENLNEAELKQLDWTGKQSQNHWRGLYKKVMSEIDFYQAENKKQNLSQLTRSKVHAFFNGISTTNPLTESQRIYFPKLMRILFETEVGKNHVNEILNKKSNDGKSEI